MKIKLFKNFTMKNDKKNKFHFMKYPSNIILIKNTNGGGARNLSLGGPYINFFFFFFFLCVCV